MSTSFTFDELETERLDLRIITEEKMRETYKHLAVPEQMKALGHKSEKKFQKEKENFFEGYSTFSKKFVNFILLEKKTKDPLGWCGYHTWYIEHFRAEIGYGLFDDTFKQKGYMSEALKTILKYGFEKMQLHRVEAFIGSENEASLNLVKKFNFTYEGKMRQHYKVKEKMEDSLVFSLLKHEFVG